MTFLQGLAPSVDAEAEPVAVSCLGRTRVSRAIRPGKAGTIKLLRRFGDMLQLVRYRYDATGLYRYTTVELLVDQAPVTRGRSLEALFAVRIGYNEPTLRAAARHHGGKWDAVARRWILCGRAVLALNLIDRVDLAPRTATTTTRKRPGPSAS